MEDTAWIYGVTALFIAAMDLVFVFAVFLMSMVTTGIAVLLLNFIDTDMVVMLRYLCSTHFILMDEGLMIKTSILILVNKPVPLETVDFIMTALTFGHQNIWFQFPHWILPSSRYWQNLSVYNQLS